LAAAAAAFCASPATSRTKPSPDSSFLQSFCVKVKPSVDSSSDDSDSSGGWSEDEKDYENQKQEDAEKPTGDAIIKGNLDKIFAGFKNVGGVKPVPLNKGVDGEGFLLSFGDTERVVKVPRTPNAIKSTERELATNTKLHKLADGNPLISEHVQVLSEVQNTTHFLVKSPYAGRPLPDGKLPIAKVYNWFHQIVKTMAQVHKLGLGHLDLVTGNILVDREDKITIIDFGESLWDAEWEEVAFDTPRPTLIDVWMLGTTLSTFLLPDANVNFFIQPTAEDKWRSGKFTSESKVPAQFRRDIVALSQVIHQEVSLYHGQDKAMYQTLVNVFDACINDTFPAAGKSFEEILQLFALSPS
jgi:hypothetical protein